MITLLYYLSMHEIIFMFSYSKICKNILLNVLKMHIYDYPQHF